MMNPDDLETTVQPHGSEADLPEEAAVPSSEGASMPEGQAEASQTSSESGEELSQVDLSQLPLDDLTAQKQAVKAEVDELSRQRDRLAQELETQQASLQTVLEDGLVIFKQRQAELQRSLEQLERRRESIRKEMRESFVGTSQDLALRVQGFKDYLVGSLQDLATTADKLELVRDNRTFQPSPQDNAQNNTQNNAQAGTATDGKKQALPLPEFAQKTDMEQEQQIRDLLDRYRTSPDYYGPPWQLRRTFEPVHEDAVSKWFFAQGGRGALRTLGSRLQNILVASSAISVLNEFYGDRVCALILANSPERLGDWRRGLQECLGVSRQDFGPNQGIVLCESPDVLAQRAERMLQVGDLPLVILDESEMLVDVALLRFPLWMAFAPDPAKPRPAYDDGFGPERQEAKGGGLFEGGPDNLFGRAFGSLGLGREEAPRSGGYGGPAPYDQSRYSQPSYDSGGYGQQSGSSGQAGYGQSGYGQQGYGQPGYEQNSYGQDPYAQGSGYDQPGANPSEYDSQGYGQQDWNDPNDGYGQADPRQAPRQGSQGQGPAPGNDYGDEYGARREPRRSRYSEGDQSDRYGRDSSGSLRGDRDDNADDWL